MGRRLIVEADGGSRGNPGPAAYGTVVKDADTGAVLFEEGRTIGIATNNVAEYDGLVAGLRAAAEIDATATVEARLDSKLVVEQMSGRWKIKHEDMRARAIAAREAFPYEAVTLHVGAAGEERPRRPAGQRGTRRASQRRATSGVCAVPPQRARRLVGRAPGDDHHRPPSPW